MRAAGAGVVVVSWYPPGRADQKAGRFAGFQDRQVPMLAVAAVRAGLELAFHAEPYPGRTAAAAAADVELLCERHGALPGVHRRAGPRGLLPLVYVYDSYLVGPREWAAQLGRGLPAYLLGLAVERAHLEQLRAAGFDGAYSYFASDGFVWGSTAANWPEMGRFCRQHGLMSAILGSSPCLSLPLSSGGSLVQVQDTTTRGCGRGTGARRGSGARGRISTKCWRRRRAATRRRWV